MNEALFADIVFRLIELGIRNASSPEDVEEYIRLRRSFRLSLVAKAEELANDSRERQQLQELIERADDDPVREQEAPAQPEDSEPEAPTAPEVESEPDGEPTDPYAS